MLNLKLPIWMVFALGLCHFVAQQTTNNNISLNSTNNTSMISIFEIPATDFKRATTFYKAILNIDIQEMDMQGSQMGLFPSDGQSASGVIIKGEGYAPSQEGVLIYLNGGNDLQVILDKIEANGGEIVLPKTIIDEENGYFAFFLDSEGNKIGLHSMK
ncbi:VOC family protein [Portibacter lacus]|uniref:Glyoxalase/fosfomycin resistance/dioxygenase domain-containing protein n=1 Tax=Portibacter lacus TaxID=1099794 RepID=A0AA37SSX2_9BACT|nr:VOC family protein [Portibacter lacus]GLR19522.1 hypothetical protein GCM10007940_41380 [Portibacter lacus]